ncbi:LysR substrate-binding domain-containing protein [Palleronia caenipelagi]|uniref:LysR family transcriptional regulator n=1 Tax=Palleronia caenipelagi TaxID=2489174 RepID=A0A547QAD5_9RHOB|nr:LysR substrate-binding domain-containing protein [Palleronia caenipelagi]TRD23286.1 LysR family transcriptional regulator [Palleronia caenipelagi]
MDWRDIPSLSALRAFEAAARCGSLSAAARELNVTHAAVAQSVRRLESHFGCPLLVRAGAGMAPTPEGQRLAAGLGDGFGQIAGAVRELARRNAARPLRLALAPSLANNWLMPRIGDFWAEHPDIQIELVPGTELVDLRRDGFDMALRYGTGPWPGVTTTRLFRATHVLVAPPELGLRPVASLADLSDCDVLTERYHAEDLLWAEREGLRHDRITLRRLPTLSMVLEAVRTGYGAGLMPWVMAQTDVQAGRLQVLYCGDTAGLAYHMLTLPGRVPGPALRSFMSWLRKQADLTLGTVPPGPTP